jgi:hypothetical protein
MGKTVRLTESDLVSLVKRVINEQTMTSSFESCFAKDNIKWINTKTPTGSSAEKNAMEIRDSDKRTIIYKGQDYWESGPGKILNDKKMTQQKIKWVCKSNGVLEITPNGPVSLMTFD